MVKIEHTLSPLAPQTSAVRPRRAGPGPTLVHTADGVFAAQLTITSSREYRDDLRSRGEKAGRNGDDIRLFPGVIVTAAPSREAALAKRQKLNDLVGGPDARLAALAHLLGVDPDILDIDGVLPPEVHEGGAGATGFRQAVLAFFEEPGRTVGDFLREGSLGHRTLVGDPVSIADDLESWLDAGAADGFVLVFESNPDGLRDFVELVVPELQRRGLTRTEYADGGGLGALLGLDRGMPVRPQPLPSE